MDDPGRDPQNIGIGAVERSTVLIGENRSVSNGVRRSTELPKEHSTGKVQFPHLS